MDKIERKAYSLYQKDGSNAVYKYAHEIGVTDWRKCKPCEEETPSHNGDCLVCNTPHTRRNSGKQGG